jgi:hypothetical protein
MRQQPPGRNADRHVGAAGRLHATADLAFQQAAHAESGNRPVATHPMRVSGQPGAARGLVCACSTPYDPDPTQPLDPKASGTTTATASTARPAREPSHMTHLTTVRLWQEHRFVQDALRVEDYRQAILDRTRQRIGIFDGARRVWRFAESLKSISADTAQEYEDRAVLELIQNGHDALPAGGQGRIKVRLDLPTPDDSQADDATGQADEGVLYVANDGRPFVARNFEAITELALSDKAAGQGIGNKGLGFRSVLQLTDWPEIYSKSEATSAAFDGYCFRFATPADVKRLVEDEELADRVIAEVSPLALPLPADVDDQVVSEFSAEGYSTVVRLPLRNATAAAAARRQLEALTAAEAPLLLFLERVSALHIEIRDAGELHREKLMRGTAASSLVAAEHAEWVKEVELGTAGRYLLARRTVDRSALMRVIERSVEDRQIDERWRDWDGEASVGVALRLDAELTTGRLYTFLPMAGDAKPPLTAHVHAPFFTKLARLDISETVALNDFLLSEVAMLAVELLSRTLSGRRLIGRV